MLRLYLKWPLFLSILFIIMDIQLFVINRRIGVIGAVYCVIFILITLILNFFGKKGIRRDLVQFAENYGKMQMSMIKEMDIPYAVLSEEGQLLWGNDKFLQVIVNKKAARRSITNIFPEITQNILPKLPEPKEAHVQAGERYYRCVMNLIVDSGSSVGGEEELAFDQMLDTKRIIAMCLYEETEVINLEKVREAENLVVGLLYIDNYDEALENVEEVRSSLLVALIERKINKYFGAYDGIVRKLEKDRFFVVMQEKALTQIRETRFDLLQDIKTVNIGNEMAITLSIGIGSGGGSYTDCMEYARSAMDLHI